MSFKVFDGECKTLKTQFFGQFSHLKLADEDTAYCIASGPARCASVIEVHLNSEEVLLISLIISLPFPPPHVFFSYIILRNLKVVTF